MSVCSAGSDPAMGLLTDASAEASLDRHVNTITEAVIAQHLPGEQVPADELEQPEVIEPTVPPVLAPAQLSMWGRPASAAVWAGCVATAVVEAALEPVCGSLGVRLFRRATRAAYRAAGCACGVHDAGFAVVGALTSCLR